MDEARRAHLEAAGIDVGDALARFMNNEALMTKFLSRFSQDKNYALLKRALEDGDAAGAYAAAHTLKGVAGNLSMRALYDAACAVVEPLRAGDMAGALEHITALDAAYGAVMRALND